MNRSNFLIIFEQIMKNSIKIDNFNFNFEQDTNDGLITCIFNTNNQEQKIIQIQIEINNSNYKVIIDTEGKKEEIPFNQFMIKYNSEYQKFKQALKRYRQQELNKKYINNYHQTDSMIKSNGVPKINLFNDLLNKETNKELINLKVQNINFDYTKIQDENLQNMYQVAFSIPNEELYASKIEEDTPYKWDILGIIKYMPENSIFVKFIKTNPNNEQDKEELTLTEFKEQYKDIFKILSRSLSLFEQIIIKRKSN